MSGVHRLGLSAGLHSRSDAQHTKVIVQLVNDETSLCWTSEFTPATKNDATQFKAKTP